MPRPRHHQQIDDQGLTERQREILRLIIQQYVLTANPVGSRYISRISSLGLSDATLRNVMADLELLGYIDHPHTSAGRMPTDKGYRLYVDSLMNVERLTEAEQHVVRKLLGGAISPEDIVRESTSLLARLSQQLSFLVLPALDDVKLERVEIVQLASNRILIVIAASSGRVRTVTLETETELDRSKLDELARLLNERLAGRTFREVKAIFRDTIHNLPEDGKSILRVFVDTPERLFDDPTSERVKLSGAANIFAQPEFLKKSSLTNEEFQSIIELIENREIVIHVLEKSGIMDTSEKPQAVNIRIGSELEDERMANYSIISTKFRVGDENGTIAVIGPKRMNYARMMPLVEYVAYSMSHSFDS
jgi:heat-inducible transcriptional repressor